MRKLVIGDIHGCYNELLQLVEKAGIDEDDEIIALGDIVDKGPDSLRVFDFFRCRRNSRVIKGNHEHKHILIHEGVIRPSPAQQITAGQFDGADYGEFADILRNFPYYLDTAEALLIHGAFEPGRHIGLQKKEVLLATRRGEAYLRKRYPKPWYRLYDGEKPIIAAHRDYSRKGEPIIVDNRVFLLDTGCCYGKRLSGIILPDFDIVSIKSHKNYWSIAKQRYRTDSKKPV